jgi:prepilin-type N-terminal cleavage/methylation domain-containing protein
MKTINGDKWQVASLRHAPARQAGDKAPNGAREACSRHVSRVTCHAMAFTLIELLTVISIIAMLAAFTIPVLKGIKRQQYLRSAQAEMEQIETAIERYKAAYGFYPPDNPCDPRVNQLYFELLGTAVITNGTVLTYQSLDDPTIQIAIPTPTQNDFKNVFGSDAGGNNCVNGFMNCTKPGAGEDTRPAQNFLPGLKPDQVTVFTNNFPGNQLPIKLLVVSVGGPDFAYSPLGTGAQGINPWRYNSSNPTNNPGAYDLWIQLSISGKTNLICNWNKQVQYNSPLP